YQEGNPTSYPAAYPGVIAVASASDTDQHSSFSNTGTYVSISAPGGSASGSTDTNVRHWITSLYPTEKGLYQPVNGTSQATPHAAHRPDRDACPDRDARSRQPDREPDAAPRRRPTAARHEPPLRPRPDQRQHRPVADRLAHSPGRRQPGLDGSSNRPPRRPAPA